MRQILHVRARAFHSFSDLGDHDLCTKEFADVDEMASCYNSTLQAILNKYAPLKTKTDVNRKHVPWFNSQMKAAI